MEKEIFNAKALKAISKEIKKEQKVDFVDDLKDVNRIKDELEETKKSIANVTEIIVKGQMFDSLLGKLTELEERKKMLEVSLLKIIGDEENKQSADEKLIDLKYIPSEYARVKVEPSSIDYKTFIQEFIAKIDVGKYNVDITIKTGLDIFAKLDKTFEVRRKEIYEVKTS